MTFLPTGALGQLRGAPTGQGTQQPLPPQIPPPVARAVTLLNALTGAASLKGRVAPQEEPPISPEAVEAIQGILSGKVEFEYLDLSLRGNKQVALAAVSKNGYALGKASNELRNDIEVVVKAVSNLGFALEYASDDLKNNRVVVLAAISNERMALRDASPNLRNDKEVVLAAISQNNIDPLDFASPELVSNREFMLAAVSKNGWSLMYASPELRNNIEIASAAVAQKPEARRYVSHTILERANSEITKNPALLPFVHPSLITYEIAQKAVKINPLLIRFVPPELLADRAVDGNEDNDIISLALNANPEAINLIPWDLLTGTILSYVIARHESSNRNELVRSLVKFARKMGTKSLEEIQRPHLDLAWPLLPFFNNFKEIMLILITKFGLEPRNVSLGLSRDPDILTAAARTKAAADALARQRGL